MSEPMKMPKFIINAIINPPNSLSLCSNLPGIEAQHAFIRNPFVNPIKPVLMITVAE